MLLCIDSTSPLNSAGGMKEFYSWLCVSAHKHLSQNLVILNFSDTILTIYNLDSLDYVKNAKMKIGMSFFARRKLMSWNGNLHLYKQYN